jgi:hypothetical protein
MSHIMVDYHHHQTGLVVVFQSHFNCSNLVDFVFFKQLLNNHRNQSSLAGSSEYLRSFLSLILTDNHNHHQLVLVVVVVQSILIVRTLLLLFSSNNYLITIVISPH